MPETSQIEAWGKKAQANPWITMGAVAAAVTGLNQGLPHLISLVQGESEAHESHIVTLGNTLAKAYTDLANETERADDCSKMLVACLNDCPEKVMIPEIGVFATEEEISAPLPAVAAPPPP